ncbi:MAG: hypothetical protein AAF985_11870, partial [Bacteroidota bacterium]
FLDQSRCMVQTTTKQVISNFPSIYSNPQVNTFLQTYLQKHYSDARAKLFVWRKYGHTYRQLSQQKLTRPLSFPFFQPGHYLISSNDLIQPFLIDIYITPNNVLTKIYFNCVVHH